jgi:hypothetical protein
VDGGERRRKAGYDVPVISYPLERPSQRRIAVPKESELCRRKWKLRSVLLRVPHPGNARRHGANSKPSAFPSAYTQPQNERGYY